MRIDVTEDDLLEGERCSHTRCPVALAILRQTGVQCRVSPNRIQNPDGGRWVATPDLEGFIRLYDHPDYTDDTEPFSFDLPDDFLPDREG